MNYPGDLAEPKEVARWMFLVASTEYDLPGILPVMTSCTELTDAWTSTGNVRDVPGYIYSQDYDSLGYFQQRYSQGWGTPAQLIDADYALRAFCTEAIKYKGQYRESDPEELGAWCQAVQRSAYPDAYYEKGYPLAVELLKNYSEGVNTKMVKASEIIEAARQLEGAYYRWWYVGASLPMWLDDGYSHPPASYIQTYGCMCSDLINWAREECGLPAIGGTADYAAAIVNVQSFDPSTPGVPGAICVKPYYSPYSQGHVALYTGEHQVIQSVVNPGVTEAYTDAGTSEWPGCEFEFYGLMSDVDYSEGEGNGSEEDNWYIAVTSSGWLQRNGSDWSGGWWDSEWGFHRS